MGTIQLFKLPLSDRHASMTLTGGRTLETNHYYVESETFHWLMPIDDASALGFAAKRLQWRLDTAAHKSGRVFRREMPASDGGTLRIELGMTDNGTVYFDGDGVRIECDDEQGRRLLGVLLRLNEDANDVAAASAVPQQLNLTPGIVDWYWGRPSW
jgi:hypothetical protein